MNSKDVIAIVALVLFCGLLAPYVIRNEVPPDVILLIAGPGIAGVLAYYFGAHNGNITGLASAAGQLSSVTAQLANQALEKRVVAVPVVMPPSSGGPPPASP